MAPLIALAFKLLPLMSAVPEVIDALKSGNATEAAGKVLDVAKRVTGMDDPEAAATAIINNPQLQLEFQKSLIAERVKYAELASAERLAQIEVNKIEAASDDKFKSRWRPALGWVCVLILGLTYIPKALVLTAFWAYGCYLTFAYPATVLPVMPPFPDLGVTDVIGILGTLLGAGGMALLRTKEKQAGVA